MRGLLACRSAVLLWLPSWARLRVRHGLGTALRCWPLRANACPTALAGPRLEQKAEIVTLANSFFRLADAHADGARPGCLPVTRGCLWCR